MARVADLVKDGDECLLEHPEIGKVRWSDHTDNSNGQKWSLEMGGYLGGFMLIFAEGPEKNKPLGKPIPLDPLPNGVVVIIMPDGGQRNMANKAFADQFMAEWEKDQAKRNPTPQK